MRRFDPGLRFCVAFDSDFIWEVLLGLFFLVGGCSELRSFARENVQILKVD